jgi:hypothetical protein
MVAIVKAFPPLQRNRLEDNGESRLPAALPTNSGGRDKCEHAVGSSRDFKPARRFSPRRGYPGAAFGPARLCFRYDPGSPGCVDTALSFDCYGSGRLCPPEFCFARRWAHVGRPNGRAVDCVWPVAASSFDHHIKKGRVSRWHTISNPETRGIRPRLRRRSVTA